MFKNTVLYSLLIWFLSGLCTSQAQNTKFHSRIVKNGELSFPIFLCKNSNKTVEKINQLMQITELEIIKKIGVKNIFQNVSIGRDGLYGNKIYIDFEILQNNEKTLALKFNESASGMTTHYWVKYYNFNAGNGDLIQLKDLFTTLGFQKFKRAIAKKRIVTFKAEVQKAKLSERKPLIESMAEGFNYDDLDEFYIKHHTIYIDGENWLHKNDKFYGLNMITKFNLNEFSSFLNDYGKTVFSLTKNLMESYRSTSLPQLFKGKIAGQQIKLCIVNKDGHVKAEYAYVKYGNGILLEGNLKNNQLTLTERNSNYDEVAIINANFNSQTISGIWKSKTTGKSYPLKLERM